MRKELAKKLKLEFALALERTVPQFIRCGDACNVNGEAAWYWSVTPELTFFILLNIADNAENFGIEVAWSDDGRYPWHAFNGSFEAIDLPKFRHRLSFLWISGKFDHRWEIIRKQRPEELRATLAARSRGDWEEARRIEKSLYVPVEDALARISPLVEDAVGKIAQYGLPLFQRVANGRGIPMFV